MRIRTSGLRPWVIAFLAAMALSLFALISPVHAYASSYGQGISSYYVSVTKTWDEDSDPEPVDITMRYTGTFDLEFRYFSDDHEFPETIDIYYQGQLCGTASKAQWVFNDPLRSQRYSVLLEIPLHFDSYDSLTRSQTLTVFDTRDVQSIRATCENIYYSFSVGDDTVILMENMDSSIPYYQNEDFEISNVALFGCDDENYIDNPSAIESAAFTESSASGVRYDYTVTHTRTDTPRDPATDYVIQFTITDSGKPEGSLELTATKTVDGGAPDRAYTFLLLDGDGNVLQTKQNGSDGTIRFDAIGYDRDDVGHEHTYQVVEQAGSDDGITYDDSVYVVTVTPYQDPDDVSKIVASPTITMDGQQVSSITFDNGKATPEPAAPEPTPATGDPSRSLAWLAVTAAAACGVFLGLRRSRG